MKSSSSVRQDPGQAQMGTRLSLLCAIGYATLIRVQEDVAFRIQVSIVALLIPLAFIVGDSAVEFGLLIFVVILVTVTEIVRAAIDLIADHLSTDPHPALEAAKLLSCLAVLAALAGALTVWLVIGTSNFSSIFKGW